jgi:hypothetical protein
MRETDIRRNPLRFLIIRPPPDSLEETYGELNSLLQTAGTEMDLLVRV